MLVAVWVFVATVSTEPTPSTSYIAIAMSVDAVVIVTVGVPASVTIAKNAIWVPIPAGVDATLVCHCKLRESVIVAV